MLKTSKFQLVREAEIIRLLHVANFADNISSGCGYWKVFAAPFLPPAPSRLPFPPLPHKYRLSRTWPPWQGRAHFKTCNTRYASRWIGTTGRKYGDEIRHFTASSTLQRPALKQTAWLDTALTLWSPLTGVSFATESAYFQSANTTRVIQSSTSRNKHLPASRMAELLPGKLQACWKWTAPWNRQSKHATASASGTKMQISCYHQRASSCNFNQSRTEALPVSRSRAAGEGREGEPWSSTQSSTGSPGQEHMMLHGAKTNKAREHSICQAKP